MQQNIVGPYCNGTLCMCRWRATFCHCFTAQSSCAVNSGVFKMLTTRRRFAVMSWTHTQIKLKLVTVLEIILLPWNPRSPWEVGLSTSKLPKYLYILNTPMATKLVLPLVHSVFFKNRKFYRKLLYSNISPKSSLIEWKKLQNFRSEFWGSVIC